MASNVQLEKAKNHIANAMLDSAFSELKALDIENSDLKKELVMIESRYRIYCDNINKTKKHSLSEENLENELNKINQALLDFIEKMNRYFNNDISYNFLNIFDQISWLKYLIYCILIGILAGFIKYSILTI